ncbi:MAG: hypothetical protein M1492_13190 [Gammaproteobacteria bacterium]|nr:hypothetical protein [Gammaproteobacteria bacterium]
MGADMLVHGNIGCPSILVGEMTIAREAHEAQGWESECSVWFQGMIYQS